MPQRHHRCTTGRRHRGWHRVSEHFGVQAMAELVPARPQEPAVERGRGRRSLRLSLPRPGGPSWAGGKMPAGQEWGLSPAPLSPPVPRQGSTPTPLSRASGGLSPVALEDPTPWAMGGPSHHHPVGQGGGADVTPIHSCRRDLGPQDRWRPRAPKKDKRFKLIKMPG